jgi:hypothetical protein
MWWFDDSERDSLFIYDDGSSITCLNSDRFFLPGTIECVSPVTVRNSSDVYSRIKNSGIAYGFGKVYLDVEQFVNIICAHDVENDDVNFEVREKKNKAGKRYGYDIIMKKIGITLFARWCGKVMVGSLKPLLECREQSAEKSQSYTVNFLHDTNSKGGAKSSVTLRTMAKTERAVNRVRKVQYRLGYMADEHAVVAAKSGFYKNLPISGSDFRYATSVYGPDIPMLKGKGKIDRKVVYEDLVPQLKDGELLVEIDLGFIGHHCFLIGITEPFNFGVAVYLGCQKGYKKAESLFHAIMEVKRTIEKYDYKIKFLVFDSERSLSKDGAPIDVFSVQDKLFDEFGIICQQLPPGVHAKRVERRIGVWKGKIRSCIFRLVFAIPQSWIPELGIAAMIWCNIDVTNSNHDMKPPLMLIQGGAIDCKNVCVSSFGELILSPVDHGLSHNSTSKGRRIECVYLYPKSAHGSHKLLVVDSIEGRKEFISRNVKTSEVMPYTPLSVVARINNQAKKEISVKGVNSEDMDDLIKHTGYNDSLQFDTPNDLLSRDRRTISIEPLPSYTETTAYMVDKEDDFDSHKSCIQTQQRETVFWLQNVDDMDQLKPYGYNFTVQKVRKEIPYTKARVKFDASRVDITMKAELEGLVPKWHPVDLRAMSEDEKKNILPGHGLIKKKPKDDDEDFLKGRFVGGGHRQKVDQYDIYREISSPTASLSSLFAVAAHAAAKRLAIGSFDVKMAYTKAPMPKDGRKIFIRLTKQYVDLIKSINMDLNSVYTDFQNEDGSVIVQLDYALYGCVEAGRLWYNYFSNILVEKMGYKISSLDDCVFNLFDESGIIISTIVVHVDDGLVTGSSEDVLDDFFRQLKIYLGDITIRRGRTHNYLGMLMDFSQSGVVHITIEKMIHSIISDWEIGKTTRNSPARSQLFEVNEESLALDMERSQKLHRGIAQLLYLSTHVRPDILCAVIFLTSRVQKLTEEDLSKFMDILYYLNGTISLGIMLGADKNNLLRLYAFADASYGVHLNGRSHGGTFITYGRGPILVRSNVLKEVSISSSESELMQLSNTTSLAARERYFAIEQQHINSTDKGILLEDNKSAIHMSHNGKSISNRTRHIKVKYFFVKQFLDNGEFELQHCPTREMIADILTKPLQGELFYELRDYLLGYEALSH